MNKIPSQRSQAPATTIARVAIDASLRQESRRARHTAIASYAEEMAGTKFDLDPNFEHASVEHLTRCCT